jgi:16S rRNA (adenine1518-N6/adenine1519-N6)-dimethyltransferase
MYKPTDLHEFLQSLGISPKKGLSQNFLIDGNIIRKIVAAAHVTPGDLVLEIGPGPGSLTQALLEAGAHVIAVEMDTILAQALERFQTPDQRLKVVCQDIMKFDLESLPKDKKIKVVANLPYHVTTPIVASLVQNQCFDSIVVMVQDEVARRFVGRPGTKQYGSFTVFLRFYSDPEYSFTVSRNCFYPVPNVDSAIVSLKLKEHPYVTDVTKFFEMTRRAFQQRRKMLRSSLNEIYGQKNVMQALNNMGLDEKLRPEELSLEQFIQLFELLSGKTSLGM